MARCPHPMTKRIFTGILPAAVWLATAGVGAQAVNSTVTIQANLPGATVSPNLFGIFFEEINFGGDGGLYAELVRNR